MMKHAIFVYHLYNSAAIPMPWCRKPKVGMPTENFYNFRLTNRPEAVTCFACLVKMQQWKQRQPNNGMPMEFI